MDDVEAGDLAFAAALAFLDDYEAMAAEWLLPNEEGSPDPCDSQVAIAAAGELSVSPPRAGSDSPTRPSTQAASHARPQRRARSGNPNRARNERRYELLLLRRQVDDLSEHLAALHKVKRHKATSTTAMSSLVPIPTPFLTSPPAPQLALSGSESWKNAAWRYYAQRQCSEKENIRLRLLVERQAKIAKRLEKLVAPKRTKKTTAASVGTMSQVVEQNSSQSDSVQLGSLPVPVALSSTAAIFDMLLGGALRARDELDAIFRENGLANTEKAYRSAKVEQDEANSTVIEFVASKVLPYDLKTTHQVVWRHFGYSQPQMPDRTLSGYHGECKDLDADGGTITSSYRLVMANPFVEAKFDEWHIVRCFAEPDRVVIILCSISETVEFAAELVAGIRVLERAYIVLRRPRGGASEDSTVMQTCYRLEPTAYKDSPLLQNQLAGLTDFLFTSVAGTISVNHQMIENALQAQTSSRAEFERPRDKTDLVCSS